MGQLKAKKNLRKHVVSFDEATSAFYDALSVTFQILIILPARIDPC